MRPFLSAEKGVLMRRVAIVLTVLACGFAAGSSPAFGQTMPVLYLDGSGAHVVLPPDMFHAFAESTVEAWVRWEQINTWSRVFDFGREGNAAVVHSDKASRTLSFAIYDRKGKRHRIRKGKAIPVGQWFHLAVVCGAGKMALYINGELKGTDGYEGGLEQVTGGTYYLGRSNWPDDTYFQGYVSEFRIWNRRRSRNEILHTMQRRLTGAEPNLAAYWRFDTEADGQVPDSSPGGHPARLVAGARLVAVPAISRYLIPGEIEKDVLAFSNAGKARMGQGDPIGAYREYLAALDLAPGRTEIRTAMLDALDAGRFWAALFPFETHTKKADPDRIFEAARTELLKHSPPYADWMDASMLQFMRYEQGVPERADDQALIAAAKAWNVRLLVLGDIHTCKVDRSGSGRDRKTAFRLRTVQTRTEAGQDSVWEERGPEVTYRIVRREARAVCSGIIRVLDVETGKILDQGAVSAEVDDRVEYADSKENPYELWTEKRRRSVRVVEEEDRFRARRDLKDDTELLEELMQAFGTRVAQRVQFQVLKTYAPVRE